MPIERFCTPHYWQVEKHCLRSRSRYYDVDIMMFAYDLFYSMQIFVIIESRNIR